MGIFDFGRKQRMYTRLDGHISGQELFKVDEYKNRKATTVILSGIIAVILTVFYFSWKTIPINFRTYMIIICLGLGAWLFFNFKEQRRLKESLY